MSTGTMARGTLALSILLLLVGGSSALAADQPISAKKLRLKGPSSFVLLAKDTNISSPVTICNGVPREVPFATLTFDDGVNSQVFNLPCDNWKPNGAGTSWTFKNKEAPAGPSEVKLVKVRDGQLKVVGKGLGSFPVPSGAATIDIVLSVRGVGQRFCMSADGTGDGSKFLATNAPAPSACAPPACQATTGGLCWFLADFGQSCSVFCPVAGLVYDPATASFAGDAGTDANCLAVVNDLGSSAGSVAAQTCFSGAGCLLRPVGSGSGAVRCSAPPTTGSGSEEGYRACACQ